MASTRRWSSLASPIPIAVFEAGGLALADKPEADRDLGGIEQLAGQGDHAFDAVIFDQLLADLPFTAAIAAHGAVGQHKTGDALLAEFGEHMQDPGVVGIAGGRGPEAGKARVLRQLRLVAPLF